MTSPLCFIVAAALTACMFGGCPRALAEQIDIDQSGNQQNITNSDTPVFFVTDRQETIKDGRAQFNSERSPNMTYGICFPDPGNEDKRKVLVFHSADQFHTEFAKYAKNGAIIFVHGYRRTFSSSLDLACDAAQKLHKPLIVFSWPAKNMYVKYFVDETTAEWSGHQFAEFLVDLGSRVGNKNIMIISHSLGARVVTSAFQTIALDRLVKTVQPFGKLLFCSPDIDRDIFADQSWLLKKMCGDVRVYVSSKDKRICISNVVHGSPRLGWSVQNAPMDGVEVIDFKADDHKRFGHSIPYSILSHVVRENYQSAHRDHPSITATQIKTPALQVGRD